MNAAECAALREFQVQSESVKTLNAAGCRTLETFNAYAPKCETLGLNRCALFGRPATTEMNTVRTNISGVRALTLDGCKRLTSTGFANLLDQCASTLERLSAEGCFAGRERSSAATGSSGASSAGVQRSKSCAFPARSVARVRRARVSIAH